MLRLQCRLFNQSETAVLVGSVSSNCTGRCVLLHDRCTCQNLTAVSDVAHTQIDEIATAQLTVNREIEHCQVSGLMGVLKLNPDSPDVLGLQRWLLTNQLAFVPGFPVLN